MPDWLRRIRDDARYEGLGDPEPGVRIFKRADWKAHHVERYKQRAEGAGYHAEIASPQDEAQLTRDHDAAGFHIGSAWWVFVWEEGETRPDPYEAMRPRSDTADSIYDDYATDPRYEAAIELMGRTGGGELQIRYDDEEPGVWIAVCEWDDGYECAAGWNPLEAALRLLEEALGGGDCAHCGHAAAISTDFSRTMPLDDAICWYQYDPELQTFRRGCEGDN